MMKLSKTVGLLVAGGLCLCAANASAQFADRKGMTLAAAKKITEAAEAEAMKNNWKVVIAVVDEGGNLVSLQRMDETQVGSVEIAVGKARTAASFKRPTKALEDAIAGGRNALLSVNGLLALEGGIPVMADGKMVGAVGVSGVTSQQDAQIATAGIAAIGK